MKRLAPALLLLCLLFSGCDKIKGLFPAEAAPATAGELPNEPAFVTAVDPSDYSTVSAGPEEVGRGELILVNSDHPYAGSDGEDLVSVYEKKTKKIYKVKDKTVMLRSEAMDALNRMLGDFHGETGYGDVIVVSGYRSVDDQQSLYERKVRREGEAQDAVARPGSSEHHTGLAFDLGIYTDGGRSLEYTGADECAFINANAYRYGFVVRYAREKTGVTGIMDEPWHFRYLGKAHAYLLTERGDCLEEYIAFLSTCEFGKKHVTITDAEGVSYEIYYVKANARGDTEVPVPKGKSYTISGDNVGGFIVTVTK